MPPEASRPAGRTPLPRVMAAKGSPDAVAKTSPGPPASTLSTPVSIALMPSAVQASEFQDQLVMVKKPLGWAVVKLGSRVQPELSVGGLFPAAAVKSVPVYQLMRRQVESLFWTRTKSPES